MGTVSIRELRHNGGAVVARAELGETLVITSSGRPVAQLVPLPNPSLTPAELVERAKRLPPVDPKALRSDLDAVLDQSL
ncbi:MAG: type II toxin-antitoxin system prevent-host-death family antitoxin [Bifidobacteriaceae bacterium]|jgi:prevent-host-death family protein|nr:type II toxin-antitoxin system prevent-host-death family antitoxin [Bifidobacteriaceae bacterium]